MAFSLVGVGSSANDGTGDSLRAAFQTINANFTAINNGTQPGAFTTLTSSGNAQVDGLTGLGTAGVVRLTIGVATAATEGIRIRNSADSVRSHMYPGEYHAQNSALTLNAVDAFPFIVKTTNAERLRIDSSGNVGIGTTTISTATGYGLEVQRAGITSIRLENTTNASAWEVQTLSGIVYMGSLTNVDLVFAANNAEAMRLDTSGNLGIGETSPDYKLDVNGAIGFTPGASVTPVDNGDVVFEATSNTTFTIKLKGSDGVVRSGTVALS